MKNKNVYPKRIFNGELQGFQASWYTDSSMSAYVLQAGSLPPKVLVKAFTTDGFQNWKMALEQKKGEPHIKTIDNWMPTAVASNRKSDHF